MYKKIVTILKISISKNCAKIKPKHWVKSVPFRSYSGPYFPAFGLNTKRYSVSLRIRSECGKIRTRITPNTETLRSENENDVKTLKWRYFYVLAKFVKDAFYFAGIFQLHKYQLFAFINMRNLRKGQQNRCKLGLLKRLLYDKWPVESASLSISVF